jgi:CTP synthase
MIDNIRRIGNDKVKVAIVGKYVQLEDSYLSIMESLRHAGFVNNVGVDIKLIDSETVTKDNVAEKLEGIKALVVPGGFGNCGAEGKIEAIKYVRENKIPFYGDCLGMQMAVVEYARNVLGLKDANSVEFNEKTKNPVIHMMENRKLIRKEHTEMRIGAYDCVIEEGTLAHQLYGKTEISERHRHKYEFNNDYREKLEAAGLKCSGVSPDGSLVEIVEIKDHPYFIASQFHPEFKSRPNNPAPLFAGLIKAAKNV